VDVESLDALHESDQLAAMILTSDEQCSLQGHGADPVARRRFLLTRWTLKEAAIKALGLGLGSVEPNHLEVMPADEGGWQAALLSRPGRTPIAWLHSLPEGPSHQWALACACRPDETLNLRLIRHPAHGCDMPEMSSDSVPRLVTCLP
jgi:4'-phosphopantetheinyl transferase